MTSNRSQTRNAIRNELVNFNNFQNTQVDALNNIAESLENSMKISMKVSDSLTDISNILNNVSSHFGVLTRDTDQATRSLAGLSETADGGEKKGRELINTGEFLRQKFVQLASAVAQSANRFSEMSNRMITITGATGADVRATRHEIVQGVVTQLNRETGDYFNPEKAYASIIQMAESANIGNLEAIEEMARPLLLASESTNMNQAKLTTLLNKWYTRYSWNSSDMESMVDEIRGNTAGNNASAEAVQANIDKFSDFIGAYADDKNEMNAMMQSIITQSSRMEAAGMNSGYVYDLLYQAASGDLSSANTIQAVLSASGTGLSYDDINAYLRSGEESLITAATEAFIVGLQNIANLAKDKMFSSEVWKMYYLDDSQLYNTVGAQNALLSTEDFKESVRGAQSAVESIDDKFITGQDRLRNIEGYLSEIAAGFQERGFLLGASFSDIISLLSVMATFTVGSRLLGNGGNLLGGLGGRARNLASAGGRAVLRRGGYALLDAIGSGSLGSLALTAGGVTAGLAGSIYGINTGINDIMNGQKGVGVTEIGAGALMGGGAAALGATALGVGAANFWNPVGWAALIGGGLTLAGTAIYKSTHKISANAELAAQEVASIGESLHAENESRYDSLSKLEYELYQETDLSTRRRMMEDSGLFDMKELANTTDDNLTQLVDSYQSAYKAMDKTTDQLLKTADKYYKEEANEDVKDLRGRLKDVTSEEEKYHILEALARDENINSDEKLMHWIEQGMSTYEGHGKVGGSWKKLISKVQNSSIDYATMNSIAGIGNWGITYDDKSKNMGYLYSIYSRLADLTTTEETFKKLVEDLEKEGLREQFEASIGTIQGIASIHNGWYDPEHTYRVGSNYIESDQIAQLHEGESVVPKRYNPAANITELEMLRKYYKDSTDQEDDESLSVTRELLNAIVEIKEFLQYWQEDNVRQNRFSSVNNKYSGNLGLLSRYNTYNL